jgi:hypothetical protein
MVPILSQINPVHTSPSYLSKNHFNIILPLRLDPPNGLFPSGFPTKLLWAFLFSPMCATCPAWGVCYLKFILYIKSFEKDQLWQQDTQSQYPIRSNSLWRWYINTIIEFLDIIHRPVRRQVLSLSIGPISAGLNLRKETEYSLHNIVFK